MSKYILQLSLLGVMWLITLVMVNVPARARDSPMTTTGGIVLDGAGSGVAGATVFLRGTEMIYSLVTQNDGRWSLAEVPSGTYQLYAIGAQGGTWSTSRQVMVTGQNDLMLTLAPLDNVIKSGDFEGDEVWHNWQQSNNPTALSSESFSGQAAARLGELSGAAITCNQNNQAGQLWSLQQAVTVPSTGQPKLSFVAQIATSQSSFNYAWLEAVLLVNGQPQYLIPWGQLWQKSDWTLHSLDLTAWRGQTVTVLFQAVNCGAENFTVNLDRVSVGTQVPNHNPTPMPTATPNPSGTPNPNATPTPVHTPTNPNATYVATVRQLTACENQGNHHLFIYVLDAAGQGIPHVKLRVYWPGKEVIIQTGDKAENPGLVDFPMFKGSYWVEVLDASSDVVGPLTPDIPLDVLCEATGNPVGNSLYHYSYRVTFTKK